MTGTDERLDGLGHEFVGVAGHPDDDECTYRADGTDATYCGEPRAAHVLVGEDEDGHGLACCYAVPDAANVQLNLAFSEGWRIDHVRAALTGGEQGE